MRTNVATPSVHTHEGGTATRTSALAELKRTVMTCMLWENTFYEKGSATATRIAELVAVLPPEQVVDVAIEARQRQYLRHTPLFIIRELARRTGTGIGAQVERGLYAVIERADELAEFMAMYWKDKKQPISNPVKRGLAAAFTKFNEYALAKYDRANAVRLRDVLFMVHAKPLNEDMAAIWKKLVDNKLETPDTWEVALSGGADKKATFERLLEEKKLGGLAVVRNLRNMAQAGVDRDLIASRLSQGLSKVLPFRFITAARYTPQFEPMLESAMLASIVDMPSIARSTGLLIDVSGSMDATVSSKSETTRLEAACGLAILLCELAPDLRVATFSNKAVEVPARRGFALRDAIINSQTHSSTDTEMGVNFCKKSWPGIERFIIITDEQATSTRTPDGFSPANYIINVATYQYGIGVGRNYTTINGWSERVLDYIQAVEE